MDEVTVTQADLDFVDSIIFDDLNWTFERAYAAAARHREQSIAPYREALTPSPTSKAAYSGEFSVPLPEFDEEGNEYMREINVPWTTIKEIMSAILARTTLQQGAK